jgi:hypothetical protein
MNSRKSKGPIQLCGSVIEMFRFKSNKRGSAGQNRDLTVNYQTLEERRLLASLFPTYVDGTFTLGDASGATPYALEDTFLLESNPSATKVIYLDFNGHHSVDNDWNHDIVFPAFDRDGDASSFSDAELTEIQLQFQNTAEDFLPFDVNVTTIDPGIEALRKTSGSDQEYGIRLVSTQATDGFGGFGGVAFLNSFDDSIDNPAFTLNKGANVGAMTNSHEVGHTLGLRHDGLGSQQYHPGTGGGGITSWGPIMGAPFSSNLTQWSNGDYASSTNTEDDYSIITKPANGFGFRADDFGSTIADASALDVDSGDFSVFQWGIVEENTDVDMLEFETGDGIVSFDIDPFGERANLDILARIYDVNGNVVATSDSTTALDASFNVDLEAGTYYLSVEGTSGPNTPSDYGSLGFFTITGQVNEPTPVEPVGEVGTIPLNHRWQTIQMDRSYVDPVVIMGAASRTGGSPVTVRVDNITNSTFDVVLDEWDYLDGKHSYEMVSYIVVEAGTHTLADGTLLHAANDPAVDHRWNNIDFEPGMFEQTPLVFTQTTSYVDTAAVSTRARNIDTNGFQVRLQEEQAADRTHANESLSWIAIQDIGVGTFVDGSQYQSSQTGDVVRHQTYTTAFDAIFDAPPAFFAQMQTYNGGDVSVVRSRNLTSNEFTVNIEEERSKDNEIGHLYESVGVFALPNGELNAQIEDGSGSAPQFIKSGNGFDNYSAGTNTAEAWAAYEEMLSWGEDSTPLSHDAHDHDHENSDHDHDDNCCCANCTAGGGHGLVQESALAPSANFFVQAAESSELNPTLFAGNTLDINSVDLSLAGVSQDFDVTDDAFENLFDGLDRSEQTLEQTIELDALKDLV